MDAVKLIDSLVTHFSSLDIEQIMSCFSEGVLVRYNDLDPIKGKEALHRFLSERYAGIENYQLSKRLLAVSGNTLTVEVKATFSKEGKLFESRILEVLEISEGKISEWNYVGYSTQS